MPIKGKYLYHNNDLTDVFYIRNKVFGEKDNNISYDDRDSIDKYAVHVLVFTCDEYEKPIATGRITFDGDHYVISKVAVLEEERSKYYGDFTVRMLATKGFLSGGDKIYVDVSDEYTGFFEKIGFVKISNNNKALNMIYRPMVLHSDSLCHKCTKK